MLPVEFGFHDIYPSPFNAVTTVRFGMDKPEMVNLKVYDIQGREVGALFNGRAGAGYQRVVWDAASLPSGLYLLRLESAGRMKTAKVALVR